MSHIYHVAKWGNNKNCGTEEAPFLTIQRAADVMLPGDSVIIHAGIYREWIDPKCGGLEENSRITYEAAKGEKVAIKGSEEVTGWEHYQENVWKITVPNSMFGEYNPYAEVIFGDWLVDPRDYQIHTGEVYINGKSMYEAANMEELMNPVMLTVSRLETWGNRAEAIREPK